MKMSHSRTQVKLRNRQTPRIGTGANEGAVGGRARDSPSTRMGHWGLQLRSFSARIGHHEPSTRYSISSASSHSLRILERSLGTEGRYRRADS